ncbi:RDD family protein [Stenoxybacter acetivorans]|uniref:RDD family protein n=1 Tax=Stenoxybacter acetivorans TaxID=422441 RepID=UPI00056190CC|nr:RDD family protein [Stenoxybacter acetivorans]
MLYSAPASLKRRFAALCYEGLLLAAVSAAAAVFSGVLVTFLPDVPVLAKLAVSVSFLAAWWWYCQTNWRRGQTLPMKVWRIHLQNTAGQPPNRLQLRMRFIWACLFLVLIPLLAYWALRHADIAAKQAVFAALLWWILPWGFAFFNLQRQFLYDYLAGTVLMSDVAKAE